MDKLKVLIVEDHKATQKLYDFGLHEDVFEKRFADNGQDGLDIYRSWRPDVILLDIMLPLISGYAALKEIREKEKDKTTAIIISSSLMSREDILDCARLGIQGYVIKPVNFKGIDVKILEYYSKTNAENAERAARLKNILKSRDATPGPSD
ncbi:MAG: response regulator [Syntrophales bacterium]